MSKQYSKERIDKLPKWAQQLISNLKRDRAYMEQKLKDVVDAQDGEPEVGDIVVNPYGTGIRFPKEAFGGYMTVEFHTPHGVVQVRLVNDKLTVSAIDENLTVWPEASNVVRLIVARYNELDKG